ncbi:MAG: BMP family ABC transporter substrate-binding protein [Oscillospiraceae bacterium]|jgi:basic membrane protein A|nr:BMP family ABC transporter substrate-binding protein [Oscillospiraceae bacterium]
MNTLRKCAAVALSLVMLLATAAATAEFAPVPKDELKVGFVYIGDVSDKGYTYAHHQGTLAMQEALGLSDEQVLYKTNVSEDAACESAILELIEQGCQIIFTTSFGFMDYTEALAAEYPDIIFSHCSGYKSNGVNFNNYFGRIYQTRYLSGIAAGLKTQTGKIGYVGAFSLPEVNGGANAFTLGVRSVNPEAEVLLQYTNTWYDPTTERQAAESLLDAGCDVIAQHQDTTMPQIAAQERGVWGVGYNADMTEDAPQAHLCAPIWNWGAYITSAVQSVIDGTWTPDNIFWGMNEDLVGLSPLTENNAPGAQEAIDAAAAKILAGEFDVFDGEIRDNEGSVRVEAGQRLTDAEITSIDWYVEGLSVK